MERADLETTSAGGDRARSRRRSAAALAPGDVVLIAGEVGHRQDDVRARRLPGAWA